MLHSLRLCGVKLKLINRHYSLPQSKATTLTTHSNFKIKQRKRDSLLRGRRRNGGETEMDCDVYEAPQAEAKGLSRWLPWFAYRQKKGFLHSSLPILRIKSTRLSGFWWLILHSLLGIQPSSSDSKDLGQIIWLSFIGETRFFLFNFVEKFMNYRLFPVPWLNFDLVLVILNNFWWLSLIFLVSEIALRLCGLAFKFWLLISGYTAPDSTEVMIWFCFENLIDYRI